MHKWLKTALVDDITEKERERENIQIIIED